MRAKILTYKILALSSFWLMGLLLMSSCENDMRDIDRIQNIEEEEAVDIYHDVRILYSDSAVVKAQVSGAELRIYHDSTGNYEFPKGIQIIMYDQETVESQRVTADYGVQRTTEGITEFRNNVVITMADGSIIKTEELFYDENLKEYYNSSPISMQFTDNRGQVFATSFRSDDKFERIRGESMTGYYVPSNSGQLPSFDR